MNLRRALVGLVPRRKDSAADEGSGSEAADTVPTNDAATPADHRRGDLAIGFTLVDRGREES